MNNILSKARYFIIRFFILFGFIFEMPLVGPITTRRLAFLAATIIVIINYKKLENVVCGLLNKKMLLPLIGLMGCMLITIVNAVTQEQIPGNSYYLPHYIIYLILYIVVFGLYSLILFDSVMSFANTYISIMLVQSVSVFAAAISYDVRLFLYNWFYFGDDRFEDTIQTGARIMGIGLHSAIGSIIMCFACVLLVYLAINKKIKNYVFIVEYMVIMCATFFVARTGLYIEVCLLVVYFFLERDIKTKLFNLAIMIGLGMVGVSVILLNINPVIAQRIINWVAEIFNEETRFYTINILLSTPVPDFSSEMIFGTNVLTGITPGGAQMLNDGGYVRMYCAIGIVGALLFYASFFYLYFIAIRKCKDKHTRIFFIIAAVIAFVIEYKEPFFQKYIYAWGLYALILLDTLEHQELPDSNGEKIKTHIAAVKKLLTRSK